MPMRRMPERLCRCGSRRCGWVAEPVRLVRVRLREGNREGRSVAGDRETRQRGAHESVVAPRRRPVSGSRFGSAMRKGAVARMQSPSGIGRRRLHTGGHPGAGDCTVGARNGAPGARDCAGAGAPSPGRQPHDGGAGQGVRRDGGVSAPDHWNFAGVRPPPRLALPKRRYFWIMDFVEPSKVASQKGDRGQPG